MQTILTYCSFSLTLNVENISLSWTTVASDLTASDFIWCPVIEDLLYYTKVQVNFYHSGSPAFYQFGHEMVAGSYNKLMLAIAASLMFAGLEL